MADFRIVVAFDITADSAKEAYSKLWDELAKVADDKTFGWESTDEWYTPDGQLDVDEIASITAEVIEEKQADIADLKIIRGS